MFAKLRKPALLGFCLSSAVGCWPRSCAEAGCATEMRQERHPVHELRQILKLARERNRRYQPPSPDELEQARAAARPLFAELRSDRDGLALLKDRQFACHFELSPVELGGTTGLALHEAPEHRRGGGIYFLRRGPLGRERIVQVPHSFFDVGTLEIGLAIAEATSARALFVNTVHRYQGRPPRPHHHDPLELEDERPHPEDAPADLAHQDQTFFQTFTRVAAETLPRLQVIQVHGFADTSLPECPRALVVVSPGIASGGAKEAARVAERLAALLGSERVLLHPRDTQRLGGTANAQGRALAAVEGASFLHLELSRTLRETLLRDDHLRRAFTDAVAGQKEDVP